MPEPVGELPIEATSSVSGRCFETRKSSERLFSEYHSARREDSLPVTNGTGTDGIPRAGFDAADNGSR